MPQMLRGSIATFTWLLQSTLACSRETKPRSFNVNFNCFRSMALTAEKVAAGKGGKDSRFSPADLIVSRPTPPFIPRIGPLDSIYRFPPRYFSAGCLQETLLSCLFNLAFILHNSEYRARRAMFRHRAINFLRFRGESTVTSGKLF